MPADQREEASKQIRERLFVLHEFGVADAFFVYVSYLTEVATHDLIRRLLADGKTVAVPKLLGTGQMVAVQIGGFDELKESEHGILQPEGERPYRGPIEVCVTPGLAFTDRGERLGYGRAHYDRFLARYKKTLCFALAFECQIAEHIPTESHDRAMDFVVTQSRAIRIS
jgi:5-formyltetrahydrofolate cyclo-ligase